MNCLEHSYIYIFGNMAIYLKSRWFVNLCAFMMQKLLLDKVNKNYLGRIKPNQRNRHISFGPSTIEEQKPTWNLLRIVIVACYREADIFQETCRSKFHQIFAAPFLSNHTRDKKNIYRLFCRFCDSSSELNGKYNFVDRNHFKGLKSYFVDKDICSH